MLPQNRIALMKGNAIRLERARQLARLRSQEITFRDLDLAADYMQTLSVRELLACLPWHPHARNVTHGVRRRWAAADRLLNDSTFNPTTLLSALSETRQQELRQLVERGCSTQRNGR